MTSDEIETILSLKFAQFEIELVDKARREEERSRKMKKLKKHYIIREYDFKKLGAGLKKDYDITFKPLDKGYFEKRTTFFYMKGKKYLGDQYALSDYPSAMLRRLTNIPLWDSNYPHWLIKYDDQNQLQIRAGLRQPESRLGLVTFKPKQLKTE